MWGATISTRSPWLGGSRSGQPLAVWRRPPKPHRSSRPTAAERTRSPPRLELPSINDLPLAPAVRRRGLEGGLAAQGAEAEPLEETAARLVGLVDHGPHARQPAAPRPGEQP